MYCDSNYSSSFLKEILLIQATLSQNAQRAHEFLNDLPGMSSQPAKGGIYLYPRLHLPSEIIEKAKVGKYITRTFLFMYSAMS